MCRSSFLRAADADLAGLVDDVSGAPGYYLRALVKTGGKRIRPRMLFAVSLCGQPNWADAVRAAAVAEGLHLASLLHDDVIDQADTRRGQPSSPAVLGCEATVHLGTLVALRCIEACEQLGDNAVTLAVNALRALAGGELIDCDRAFDAQLGLEEYRRVVAGKTIPMFQLVVDLAVLVAAVPNDVAAGLARSASMYGMAFQVLDDCTDLCSIRDGVGKPWGVDHRRGRYGAPTLIAASTDSAVAAMLAAELSTEQHLIALRQAVFDAGGFHAAARMAWDHLDMARQSARAVASGAALDELEALFELLDVEAVIARAN